MKMESVPGVVQVGDFMECGSLSYKYFHLVRNEISSEATGKQSSGFQASQHIYTELYLQETISRYSGIWDFLLYGLSRRLR